MPSETTQVIEPQNTPFASAETLEFTRFREDTLEAETWLALLSHLQRRANPREPVPIVTSEVVERGNDYA